MTNDDGAMQFDFGDGIDVAPLAAQLRPKTLQDYVGQRHILSADMPLHQAIINGHCHSLILWGPPGTGKTTLAEIIATHANAEVERISAVTAGVKDIRQAIDSAKQRLLVSQKRTLLFVDEVHRFNKSQQDAFLPHIEDGTILFIGATTENPAFELNRALLSRAKVYVLNALNENELRSVAERAFSFLRQANRYLVRVSEEIIDHLTKLACGDARKLLNIIDNAVSSLSDTNQALTIEHIVNVAGSNIASFDKGGDVFYDLISAFHKSVRGSDPDAALYWYARILIGGGDPLYVARRLLAIASEDIGNADPRAMQLAINAWDTFHRVGPSEGERAIAQAAVYMALAPKSNAVYQAFNNAIELAKNSSSLEVPIHLRNATSHITESLGHGAEYRYAHNEEGAFAAGESYFPEVLNKTRLYYPSDRGLEKQLKSKLDYLHQLNEQGHEQRYK
ncbi:replication-associated recombination protein A [Thalassotalea fusca]